MPFGFYGQPVYFAPIARRYMHEFGLKEEHLGAVAVSTRAHAARTPGSLRVDPISLDGYLAKPMIADPLRALDCCLVNDGASAFIMTSLERARDLRQSPAVVAGVGWASKPVTQAQYFSQSPDLLCTAGTVSGPRAFAEARIDPGDVDIAEIYDCFTIAVLMPVRGHRPRTKGRRRRARAGRCFRSRWIYTCQHARWAALALLHGGCWSRRGSGATTARYSGRWASPRG